MILYPVGVSLSPLVLLVIYALAAARGTGLITQDTITDPIRRRLLNRWCPGDEPCTRHRAVFIVCAWCIGFWAAAVPAALAWYYAPTNPLFLIPAAALAFNQITGMTSQVGR